MPPPRRLGSRTRRRGNVLRLMQISLVAAPPPPPPRACALFTRPDPHRRKFYTETKGSWSKPVASLKSGMRNTRPSRAAWRHITAGCASWESPAATAKQEMAGLTTPIAHLREKYPDVASSGSVVLANVAFPALRLKSLMTDNTDLRNLDARRNRSTPPPRSAPAAG